MLTIIDRTLSGLLILGAVGHALGVVKHYRGQPDALFWSLCATLLILLLAAINLLRVDRPADHGLAWVSTVSSLAYVGVAIAFGSILAHNIFDLRTVVFGAIASGLTLLSLRGALIG